MNLPVSHSPAAIEDGCGPMLRAVRTQGPTLRQQVFEYVRSRGQTSRADITQALDISAGSATTVTADLIAAGFLREEASPLRESGRGRPRVDLAVVPSAAYVVGVKLAFKKHSAVLADFSGNVVAQSELPSAETRRPLVQLIGEVEKLVDDLLHVSGKKAAEIRAVGIGLPGILDHETGNVAWSSLLSDRDQNVVAALNQRMDVPIVLDNDANMLTLAELWFGQGRSIGDFAVVTIESGVGMGMVLNNQLYRGAHGKGLELGHTKVQLDGALCQCGQRGCLEAYLADYVLTREAATVMNVRFDPTQPPQDVLDMLFQMAKSGHSGAETIFQRAARFLSLGLSNVVQLFDPELIILSGARMQYDYFYSDDVMDAMQKMTLNEGREPCRVAVNAWGDLVWARGASALALSHVTDILIGDEGKGA
ncbi:MAG: ROK family protein [Roseobacter sp.]